MTRNLRWTWRRVASLTAVASMAISFLGISVMGAPAAVSAGDPREVCDLCGNFDPDACDALGYEPYDSVEQPEGPKKKPTSGGENPGTGGGSGNQGGSNSGTGSTPAPGGSSTSAPKPTTTPTKKSTSSKSNTAASKKSTTSKSSKSTSSSASGKSTSTSSSSASGTSTPATSTTSTAVSGTSDQSVTGDDVTDELTDEADESDTEELVDEYVEDIPVFEQPAAPQATVDENAVTLTWTQVITTEQVDGYVVTLQSDDGLRESYVAPGVTEFTFTAVPQGIYTATVALYGPAGQSDPSQPSAPIAVDSTLRTVAPSIAADGDLAVGATVTISGAGLDANLGDVRVELHSDPVVLGSAPVAADGTYNFTVTIPDGVVAGEHSLVAFQGDLEVARAAVTVPAPLVVTSTTQIAGLIILAALAVLGVLTLVVQLSRARRREANSSQAARHASRAAATEPSGFAPVAGESVDAVPAAQLHTPERPVSQGVAQPQFPQPGRNSEREYAPVS